LLVHVISPGRWRRWMKEDLCCGTAKLTPVRGHLNHSGSIT
jgi:hypothetical protein